MEKAKIKTRAISRNAKPVVRVTGVNVTTKDQNLLQMPSPKGSGDSKAAKVQCQICGK